MPAWFRCGSYRCARGYRSSRSTKAPRRGATIGRPVSIAVDKVKLKVSGHRAGNQITSGWVSLSSAASSPSPSYGPVATSRGLFSGGKAASTAPRRVTCTGPSFMSWRSTR